MSNWIKNWFSNMTLLDNPLLYDGIYYNTVENFYQAMKLNRQGDNRFKISKMNPYQAKKAIRDKVNFPWREDLDDSMKLKIMKYALEYKFLKCTSWYKLLMETNDEIIVEWNNWGDTFWGKDINSKRGKNHLGNILMEIRNKYKNE